MEAIRSNPTLLAAREHVVDYLIGPNYWDSRTQEWHLVSGRAAVLIVGSYLIGVPLARKAMAKRDPIEVKTFVMWHNVAMALLSLWMVVETVKQQYHCAGWDTQFRLWGSIVKPGKSFSQSCGKLAFVLYIHYLSKAVEFVDTFIMILKRNDHQISFLHVYHHASTFLCWWVSINFAPGGDTYFICALNSAVHVVMYSYYLLSSAKLFRIPSAVKQGITVLQLVQFLLLFSQVLYGVFVATYYRPRIVVVLAAFQAVVFTMLFSDFFRKAYLNRSSATKEARKVL